MMTYNRVALKESAKQTLRDAKPHPAYITFVYMLLAAIIGVLIVSLSGYYEYYMTVLSNPYDPDFVLEALQNIHPTIAGSLVIVVLSLAATLLELGWRRYCMKLSKREQGSVSDLFSEVRLWGKAILISLLTSLFIFLWSLLLYIPGIIAAYRYSQALYVLLEHPEYGPLQCIRESKRIMRGNKGKLFVIQLSFMGWAILISLTWGILGIWKYSYIYVTYVRFYEYVRDVNADSAPQYTNPGE
jgi:uncharacterized membrane protein